MLLANHMKGLCVVKKVIQQAKNLELQTKIRNIISDNALALVHNPYGNYAIQTALDVFYIYFTCSLMTKTFPCRLLLNLLENLISYQCKSILAML